MNSHKKIKAEKREELARKRKKKAQQKDTLAGQILRTKVNKKYIRKKK